MYLLDSQLLNKRRSDLPCQHNAKYQNSLRLTSFQIANMYNDTLKLVCARSFQFKVLLKVLIPRTVCVWIHLKLQGKRNFGIDLGRNAVELFEALE
jgi:hypothetical protein